MHYIAASGGNNHLVNKQTAYLEIKLSNEYKYPIMQTNNEGAQHVHTWHMRKMIRNITDVARVRHVLPPVDPIIAHD